MSDKIPNIVRPRGAAFADWCVNYNGMHNERCDSGVKYKSVEKPVVFTISDSPDSFKYKHGVAFPCFKHQNHLSGGCDRCRFPTEEEVRTHDEQMKKEVENFKTAYAAVIAELERRADSGDNRVDDQNVTVCGKTARRVSGAGIMDCPVCKNGKLHYGRSAFNGHIRARCSTGGCVAWVQ